MKWFLDKKIATKLIMAFSVVLALAGFLGMFSLAKLSAVNDEAQDLGGNELKGTRAIDDIGSHVGSFRRWEMRLLISAGDPAGRAKAIDAFRLETEGVKKAEEVYVPYIDDPEEKRLYEVFLSQWDGYMQVSRTYQDLLQANKAKEAADLLEGEGFNRFHETEKALSDLSGFQVKMSDEAVKESRSVYASARIWVIWVLAACICVGLFMAIWIARQISRPVQEVCEVAKRVAAGDLTSQDIHVNRADEVGELATAINAMQKNLREMITSLSENAQHVA